MAHMLLVVALEYRLNKAKNAHTIIAYEARFPQIYLRDPLRGGHHYMLTQIQLKAFDPFRAKWRLLG